MLKIVTKVQNCSKLFKSSNPNCSKSQNCSKIAQNCSKCSKLFKKLKIVQKLSKVKIVQKNAQNCSKTLFKMLKIVQNPNLKIVQKLFKKLKIVQKFQNCSKCSKLFKMLKIVQNVQNCSKLFKMFKIVQNVQKKMFRIDQILSNSRGKKFLKIFKNFSKCQNRKSHPTATRRKRVRELKFFEIVYAIIQNNCVKFGREKLTFEQVMSKISKNLYRAHIWAYVFPP